MQVARWLHVLGVVVWVGGMFFAHMALRPAVATLDPPQRLAVLATTLTRFLAWVAVAIVVIVASGGAMVAMYGGFAAVPAFVHVMTALGVVMVAIYVWLVAVPFRVLRAGVAAADWSRAGGAMTRIRHLVAVNLVLGLVTLSVGALGRT